MITYGKEKEPSGKIFLKFVFCGIFPSQYSYGKNAPPNPHTIATYVALG
jgi:hypothetical protein